MLPGVADVLPFGNQSFDCVALANVFEHLEPALHNKSMAEIYRVLAPGGILVGQIPNPNFPIESHSRPAAISPLALEAVRRIDALFEIERSING